MQMTLTLSLYLIVSSENSQANKILSWGFKIFLNASQLTHYQMTKILDRSKLKQSADNNFKFDENSRKFSKQVEKTVGKGEIARYEQFLLFPQCFQKACFPGTSKGVIVWEWVNIF